MNRHCCFIFDYDNDLARAKQINDLSLVRGTAPAGFDDASRWREARNAGEEAVRGLIDGALSSTSATIVLIGEKTADLDYVAYAIEQSISRQNGIVGFFVHDMPDENSKTSTKGKVPYEVQAAEKLDAHHYDVHDWDQSKFEEWVEEAATEWKIYARPEPLRSPQNWHVTALQNQQRDQKGHEPASRHCRQWSALLAVCRVISPKLSRQFGRVSVSRPPHEQRIRAPTSGTGKARPRRAIRAAPSV